MTTREYHVVITPALAAQVGDLVQADPSRGRRQREGTMVHLVVHGITGLSDPLASLGDRDTAVQLLGERGSEVRQ